jgi:hypothetical protein
MTTTADHADTITARLAHACAAEHIAQGWTIW